MSPTLIVFTTCAIISALTEFPQLGAVVNDVIIVVSAAHVVGFTKLFCLLCLAVNF